MATDGRKASEQVERSMHERRRGELENGASGKKVASRRQAIAIGLSEARREGGKLPDAAKKTDPQQSWLKSRAEGLGMHARTRHGVRASSLRIERPLFDPPGLPPVPGRPDVPTPIDDPHVPGGPPPVQEPLPPPEPVVVDDVGQAAARACRSRLFGSAPQAGSIARAGRAASTCRSLSASASRL